MKPTGETDLLPLRARARTVAYEMLRIIGVLGRHSMVAAFIDSYTARFDRLGLKAHPLRYRELLATIGRESLLAMTAKMNRDLPRLLSRSKTGLLLRGENNPPEDARTQARLTLESLRERIRGALARPGLQMPGETQAHLKESLSRIEEALKAGVQRQAL